MQKVKKNRSSFFSKPQNSFAAQTTINILIKSNCKTKLEYNKTVNFEICKPKQKSVQNLLVN